MTHRWLWISSYDECHYSTSYVLDKQHNIGWTLIDTSLISWVIIKFTFGLLLAYWTRSFYLFLVLYSDNYPSIHWSESSSPQFDENCCMSDRNQTWHIDEVYTVELIKYLINYVYAINVIHCLLIYLNWSSSIIGLMLIYKLALYYLSKKK